MANKNDTAESGCCGGFSDEHSHHDEHLCSLTGNRKMASVARLAKDARFVCNICGRAAAEAKYLCDGRAIES